jgi:hypothetical protein
LQFYLPTGVSLQIDWIRLLNVNAALCRQVTWSGFAGNVDLYLDVDGTTNGNESLLAANVASNSASAGCSTSGSGYNFYAGALAPGNYQVLARPAGGTGAFTRSGSAYQVNDIPTLTITSPSEEGSTDDFATAQLGNPWDMNSTSDIRQRFNVTGETINPTFPAETPAGVSLGNVRVYSAASTQAPAGSVGDPVTAPLWETSGVRIDPLRYRILTVEFGLPNLPRSLVGGSVARVIWRVAGSTDSVSDDIIVDSRSGANVMDKVIVDMADRTVLPLEAGSGLGWVPGSSGGIDRFRFDPHEFSGPTSFYIRRIRLAALEHAAPGNTYTIRWTASKSSGTVTLYYDNNRDPSSGLVLIGSAPTSAGSFAWSPQGVTPGPYYVYAVIDDGQNSNAAYSRWPLVMDAAPPPTPTNFRIVN